MFRAHSPYSPFFTSGLLSEPISTNRTSTTSATTPTNDRSSAIYFDIVFNDDDHYRSFLSLDLAETQSLRSLSIKRKPSSKYTARSSNRPRAKFSRIPKVPSRDSLRSMPSPKPVPSMTLPEPPTCPPRSPIPTTPPRLPSLPPLPSLDLGLAAPFRRKSVTPKKPSIALSRAPSLRLPTRTPSTASTRTRLHNRAAALALLEGRQKPALSLPPPLPRQDLKNFMSMSDDEDEDDEDDITPESDPEDNLGGLFNPTFEPEDIVLPAASSKTRSLSPPRAPRINLPPTEERFSKFGGRKVSQKRTKKRSSKASEWFPLKSFIDLYNDNDDESGASNWNWRSFIEVANTS